MEYSPDPIDVPVKIKAAGMRLDHYLCLYLPDLSRSVIRRMIDTDNVWVNGKPSKASYKIRPRDTLRVKLPDPTHDLPQPEDIPLDILYEDEYLALINKPPDMVVHPAKGNWSGTLVNALQFRFEGLSNANGVHRAGIVHRLDRDTSGVILIAKEEKTHRLLAAQFEHRHVFKEYLAVTYNELDRDSDYVEAPMRHHPTDRLRMIVAINPHDEEAKEACTYYEVIERFHGFTFCRCQPKTGRTHQIRVHLAHVGCPILADKLYSYREAFWLSEVIDLPDPTMDQLLLGRQALHAHRLRFQHPLDNRWIEVEAPLPGELVDLLSLLRHHRGAKR